MFFFIVLSHVLFGAGIKSGRATRRERREIIIKQQQQKRSWKTCEKCVCALFTLGVQLTLTSAGKKFQRNAEAMLLFLGVGHRAGCSAPLVLVLYLPQINFCNVSDSNVVNFE
jgi:hypothetical protein